MNATAPEAEAETRSRKAPPAIEADRLVKDYAGRRAVDGVSFRVAPGEIVGLLGPNGAGKTTTMRILTGWTPATSGRAAIAGHDVERDSFGARARLGYLPEHTPLYLEMTPREYLSFVAELKRRPKARRAIETGEALEECGLTEVAGRPIGNLSRGYRQRVGLAQAVVGQPAVLILDEPTVGLDPRQIAEIRDLIRAMAGRRAVLLSTHILPEVASICSRAVVLNRGRVVAEGPVDRIAIVGEAAGRDERIVEVEIETDGPERAERARKIAAAEKGVKKADVDRVGNGRARLRLRAAAGADPRPAIAAALVREGFALLEIGWAGATLEDAFLRAISEGEAGEGNGDGEAG